jgi:hypothetical protein
MITPRIHLNGSDGETLLRENIAALDARKRRARRCTAPLPTHGITTSSTGMPTPKPSPRTGRLRRLEHCINEIQEVAQGDPGATQMTVAIPKRMQHLDRDHRGYPVPVMVWRSPDGIPHFTINDEAKRFTLLMDDQCSICGTKLLKLRWFVGGPLSAFHPAGSYMDPPLHRECMTYAMQVCPWLAAPVYARRIDARTVREAEPNRVFIDHTQMPDRPPVFVCVGAIGQTMRNSSSLLEPIYVRPKRPYKAVQFWKGGQQISQKAAADLLLRKEAR